MVVGWRGLGLVWWWQSCHPVSVGRLLAAWSPRIDLTTLKLNPVGPGTRKVPAGGLRATSKLAGWFFPGSFSKLQSCCLLKMKSSAATELRPHCFQRGHIHSWSGILQSHQQGHHKKARLWGFSWNNWQSFISSKDMFTKISWAEFSRPEYWSG